jgi:hypothetical protein
MTGELVPMVGLSTLNSFAAFGKRRTLLDSRSHQSLPPFEREDISEYVAHLQLHMSLQARNLVPPLTQVTDSRERLLQQTQANFEKLISRQIN